MVGYNSRLETCRQKICDLEIRAMETKLKYSKRKR